MNAAALLLSFVAVASTNAQAEVRLEIGFPEGRNAFRLGEPIRIELRFSSQAEGEYRVNTASVLSDNEFSFEPRDGVRYAFEGCLWPGGVAGSILSGYVPLKAKPFILTLDLTQAYRFRAGQYRFSVTSRRVSREGHEADPLRLSAGPADFTIAPPDPSWDALKVRELGSLLDGDGEFFVKQQAARELSYLTSDVAVDEMVRRLAGTSRAFDGFWREGLCSAPDRSGAIGRMQAVLRRPDTSISLPFLYMLATLRMGDGSGDKKDRLAHHGELVTVAARELAAALPQKTPTARLTALGALAGAAPVSPEIATELAERFDDLPAGHQNDLLGMHWNNVRSPGMIPALLRILERRPDVATSWLRIFALQRLYELDPLEGEKRITAEVRDPVSTVPARELGLLHQDTLPELDRPLLARLESGGYYDRARAAALIARYATAAIYADVRRAFERKPDSDVCDIEHPLLAYFLRVKPEDGSKLINRELAARKDTVCGRSMIFRIAGFRWSPGLEAIATEHLPDGGEISAYAAWTLGEYGSERAQAVLWKALEDFSRTWKEHPQEVPRAERFREERLASALLHSKQWTLAAAEVARISDLCITELCRQSTSTEQARSLERSTIKPPKR